MSLPDRQRRKREKEVLAGAPRCSVSELDAEDDSICIFGILSKPSNSCLGRFVSEICRILAIIRTHLIRAYH